MTLAELSQIVTSDLPTQLPRAVLFDWDNTLVDTFPAIHDALNHTLDYMGHTVWTLEETKARIRKSMRDSFPEMFGDRWQEAGDVFYQRFEIAHLERLIACEGAEDLLKTLKAKGVYLGVVSNKTGKYLRQETKHLGWDKYFGAVVGACDAERDKPDPSPVDMALAPSGIARSADVWFVGDTEIDLECALNANCLSILVRKEQPKDGEFNEFPPTWYFPSCLAFSALVERL